ncbi:hypothetical protein GCM10009127_16220 [Alteraurantiacibacter aestuarii]
MQRFARWHIWLGWLVGVPILMWTISGLVMVAQPIETVRGDHLRADPALIETAGLVFPTRIGTARSISLVNQVDGPAWIVTEEDGGQYRYSATDGTLIPPVIEDEARRIALAAYAGDAALETITYFPSDVVPGDLRLPTASWQAHFADGTNIYIHNSTGQLLAVRSSWWRVYDFMWGLHIMDLQTREDTSHPVLIIFALLGVIGSLLGCVLMFRRRKAKVRVKAQGQD